jgi:hypothetical protein
MSRASYSGYAPHDPNVLHVKFRQCRYRCAIPFCATAVALSARCTDL